MGNIYSASDLKEAIRLLEFKQTDQGQLMKEKFNLARESLRPASLIKSTFSEVVSSPLLISNVLGAAIGLSAGYFSKRIFLGSSANQIKKLAGTILQMGISTLVTRKHEFIQLAGKHILQRIFRKRKANSVTSG
jgi:hypothetical protein